MKLLLRSLYVATTLSCLWLLSTNAAAQIVPDTTLPINSIAIPNGNSIRIEGGTTAGGNLFHSFQEFSVPTGTEAFFNNSLDIQNIFSRVTGSNISNIDGLIRANGVANLFIINPNGIIFGQNAQLNIGGSFLSSTANSIKFADGSEFSSPNPAAPSLLTVNVPIGLQFGENPGRIENRSQTTAPVTLPPLTTPFPFEIPFDNKVGLAVAPGQTLALVGGDIQVDGGNLTAFTGQIILGSVASPGLVSFVPTPFGLNLNYDNVANLGNIDLSNGTTLNTSGIGGGKVDIRGRNVTISGTRILGLTIGNIDGRDININAENLRINRGSQIIPATLGDGKGSDLNIYATDSVEISGLGIEAYQQVYNQYLLSGTFNPFVPQIALSAGTVGSGAAGEINIDTGRLLLRDGATGGTNTFTTGNAGNMNIRANTVELISSALSIGTNRASAGQGGSINIEAQRLIMRDGSNLVSISRSDGASGNIAIKTSESVELSGSLPGSTAQTAIGTNSFDGNGKAGDITIDTKRLSVSDGAAISLSTGAILGQTVLSTNGGPGGNLTVTASESVEVSGESGVLGFVGFAPSSLNTATASSGRGGDIRLSTPLFILRDGALISVASSGIADAGSITLNADRIVVQGTGRNSGLSSRIEASAGTVSNFNNPNATANAGSLNVNARELIVKDGAIFNVRALGTGSAGNINVVADSIALDNQSSIDGRTTSGLGANINLQSLALQLRQGSRINTDAGNATGGNINIDTNTLVALENSDITANAQRGAGGRVSITAQGIFGTQFRNELTPQSDITATSDLGPQFSGVVEINTPDIDPSAGLIELSTYFDDVDRSIVASCATSVGNSFTITGNGGLPDDPTQALRSRAIWRDVRLVGVGESGRGGERERGRISVIGNTPIVEATGWRVNGQGEMELVANASAMIVGSSWYNAPGCGGR
ncbi:filamentous hemagglutinin N-terminal domain-containing protein [Aerosakkonema sp. BLCC-F183]|uniref:two-partner secretion domain-containing protein n=1 Tax=Aerosakkonema sp. BLCC-F183 TaxID=3342834 RepID=UPI0035B7E1DC